MIARGILFYLFFSLAYPPLFAQEKQLLLNKPGVKHDIIYKAGDEITFRMNDEKFNRTDRIKAFTDTSIVFDSYSILLRNIKFIRVERESDFLLGYSSGPKLVIAGLVLVLADFINYTLIRGYTYEPHGGIYIVSGSLVAAGIILMSARYYKFKPSATRKIQVRLY